MNGPEEMEEALKLLDTQIELTEKIHKIAKDQLEEWGKMYDTIKSKGNIELLETMSNNTYKMVIDIENTNNELKKQRAEIRRILWLGGLFPW